MSPVKLIKKNKPKKTPAKAKTASSTKKKPKNGKGKALAKKTISLLEKARLRRKKDFQEAQDIPSAYDKTQITLVARDPQWVHAYWEIAMYSWDDLREKIPEELVSSTLTLRMYDVTFIDFDGTNANHWFDIDVGREDHNWYINLWSDNVAYCADLGIRTPSGVFYPIARSNVVTTPRVSYSGRSDVIWMEVKDDAPPQSFIVTDKFGKGCIPWQTPSSFGEDKTGKRWRVPLSYDEIKAYYSQFFPLLRRIKSARSVFGMEGLPLGLSDRLPDRFWLSEKSFKLINVGASEKMLVREETGEEKEFTNWEEIKKHRLLEGEWSGASEGASVREKMRQRKFFFEIGTELIVYGRTEPDAKVYLEGKDVPLRSDGTFSMRFALPDGKIPLPFTAVSHDGIDKRHISTSVEREQTKYRDESTE